jgi:hypothetical protein
MKRRIIKKQSGKAIAKNRNKGFGTVEIVLIIAVLISLALLFRTAITSYATDLITNVFGDQSIITDSKTGD